MILNLRAKLNGTGYYDVFEVERVVNVEMDSNAKQGQLHSAIKPVADRLIKMHNQAKQVMKETDDKKVAAQAKDTLEALQLFKTDIGTYLRAYAFLSQIFDYGNTDFEKRNIFFRHLNRILKFDREREEIDLSGVVLTHHNLTAASRR